MKSGLVIIALLGVSFSVQVLDLDYIGYSKDIPHITDRDIEEAKKGDLILFMHFNADHSKENLRALKGYFYASQRIKKKIDLNHKSVFVDCTHNNQRCKQFGVHYYPQTKVIVFGKTVKVDDSLGRTHQHMTDILVNKILGSSRDLGLRSKVNKFRKKNDRFFHFWGQPGKDYEIYLQIAAAHPYMTWVHTLDREDKHSRVNGIYFYDEFEGTSDMRNGPHDPLMTGVGFQFTRKYLFLLRSLADYGMERLFVHDQAFMVLLYPDSNDERGVQIPFWHGVNNIHTKFTCIQVPIKDNRNTNELREFLGANNELSSAMRIVDRVDGRWRIFQLKDKITRDNIIQFYDDYMRGNLREFFKSEGPERDHGIIKKLVGKSFNKYVRNKDHDVIVVMHSNNSPTLSTRVLKVTEFAAKVMSRFEYLRFTKINVDKNADIHIPQRGFPLIRLFKKGDAKDYVDYDGLYRTRDLTEWISAQIDVENPIDDFINELKSKRANRKETQESDI